MEGAAEDSCQAALTKIQSLLGLVMVGMGGTVGLTMVVIDGEVVGSADGRADESGGGRSLILEELYVATNPSACTSLSATKTTNI